MLSLEGNKIDLYLVREKVRQEGCPECIRPESNCEGFDENTCSVREKILLRQVTELA